MNSQNLQALAFRFSAIALISFLIGTIVPGLVSASTGVFYQKDIRDKILKKSLEPISSSEIQADRLRKRLREIDDELIALGTGNPHLDNMQSLISIRRIVEDDLNRLEHTFSIAPFFLNDLMFAWSAMYTALGALLFIMSPRPSRMNSLSWPIVGALLGLYVLYQGPVWMRNFVLSNEQRHVFSFANYDISRAAFFMQEVNTVLMFVLIALLWHRWMELYQDRQKELESSRGDGLTVDQVSGISDDFLRWQICSALLALGFMAFTGAFWDLVVVNQDRRYLLPAIIIHLAWGFSWILISLPLFATWRVFNLKKTEMLLAEVATSGSGQKEGVLKVLQDLTPVSMWNGFGSVLTAAASFIFPLIHALTK
jgi:hypothetical protein